MIAIIDYGMGNLRSVEKALESLGAECAILSSPSPRDQYAGIILPGVGAFGDAMENLRREGWIDWIRDTVESGMPFLGICLGLQLLFNWSDEGEGAQGLGIIPGKVVKFPPEVGIIPHMGWNRLKMESGTPLFSGIDRDSYVYFVHSYYVLPDQAEVIAATTDYGIDFVSAIARNNIYGLQFHPEKSQAIGLKILNNFLGLCAFNTAY
ncbi:MAG: imidazole glycerol phosphate synthase subunit HisH [Candidatus Auribacterota bacterium]|nr:imidazole glycerol phosphate synthase subunit HisH [Candidatus Auribacterota bacterium]